MNTMLVHAWLCHRRMAHHPAAGLWKRAWERCGSHRLLSWLGEFWWPRDDGLITSALGFALLLTAFSILFRRWILDHIAKHTNDMSDRRLLWLTATLGVHSACSSPFPLSAPERSA